MIAKLGQRSLWIPTLTRLIKDAMRERAISFEEALKKAARIELRGNEPKRARKFVQKTFRMGENQKLRSDKAQAAADAIAELGRTAKPEGKAVARIGFVRAPDSWGH